MSSSNKKNSINDTGPLAEVKNNTTHSLFKSSDAIRSLFKSSDATHSLFKSSDAIHSLFKSSDAIQSLFKNRNDLIRQIRHHDFLYYNKNAPLISDYEYDNLKVKLDEIEEEIRGSQNLKQSSFDILTINDSSNYVGYKPDPKFKKIKHIEPMLSLQHSFNWAKVENFYTKTKKALTDIGCISFDQNLDFICEPKIDGVSFAIVYEYGKIKYAITRGNGVYGEDITQNIIKVHQIPHIISFDGKIEIRGEIYISKADFLEMNKSLENNNFKVFATPRNAAAGSLRQIDSAITASRNLKYFVWGGYIADANHNNVITQHDFLNFVKDLGFIISDDIVVTADLKEMLEYYEDKINTRAIFEYDIDGVVYKVNNLEYQSKLGNTAREPKWAIAYKFDGEIGITKIKDITVQISRNGVMTPVAELIPVNIGGVLISRATLHNPKILESNDYRIGDTVMVKRAGDVIPQIVKVEYSQRSPNIERYSFPDICPSCSTKLAITSEDRAIIKCPAGLRCHAQALEYMAHFVSRNAFNIDGLGYKQIKQLYLWEIIRTPVDIFLLPKINANLTTPLEHREGWGYKSTQKIFQSIEKSKKINTANFLYALGINSVGVEVAKAILGSVLKHYGSFVNFLNNTFFKMILKDGQKGKIQEALLENDKNLPEIKEIIGILIETRGVGISVANGFVEFFSNQEYCILTKRILKHITLIDNPDKNES